MLRLLLTLALIISVAGEAAAAARRSPALVLVGGALEDPRIVDEIIRLAGGPGRARVGVITAASGDPAGGAEHYRKLFRDHGAAQVEWLPVDARHKYRARSRSVVDRAEGLNVFFFGGGDQSRLVSCLTEKDGRDTPLLAAIRRVYRKGGVVAGTSAGSAGQAGRIMITGGESEPALRQGARAGRPRKDALTYHPRGGLGFFTLGIPDTHFSERGRQGRLLRLAADTASPLAFGIDENTALIVEQPLGQQPRLRVLGAGTVSLFDLTRARRSRGQGFGIGAVGLSLLGDGDRYDLGRRSSRASRLPAASPPLPLEAARADIFSSAVDARGQRLNPGAFRSLASQLMAGAGPQRIRARLTSNPDRQVILTRTRGQRARQHPLSVSIGRAPASRRLASP